MELIDKGLLNGICKQIKPIYIVIMKRVELTGLEGLMYLYSIYWIIYQGKLSTTQFCLFSPQFKNDHLLLEQLTDMHCTSSHVIYCSHIYNPWVGGTNKSAL